MQKSLIAFVLCAVAVNSFAQSSFGVKYYPSAKIQSENKQIYSFDFGYTNRVFMSNSSLFSSETFFGFDYFDNAIKSGNVNILFFMPYAYSLRVKQGVCISPRVALGLNVDGMVFVRRNTTDILTNKSTAEAKKITINGNNALWFERTKKTFLHPESKSDESVVLKEKFYVLLAKDRKGFFVLTYSSPEVAYEKYLLVFEKAADTFTLQ